MKKLAIILAPLLFILTMIACENESDSGLSKQYKINFVAAKTSVELEQLRKDPNSNLVRTVSDFNKIVNEYNTPLALLNQDELDNFRSEIVFRQGVGVVGLNYSALEKKLTHDQINNVLLLFGLDAEYGFWGLSNVLGRGEEVPPEDYKGYWCPEKGTCEKRDKSICLTGC